MKRSSLVWVVIVNIDRRDDLGTPERFDVYYGMANDRIGVARLDLTEHLHPVERATGKPVHVTDSRL